MQQRVTITAYEDSVDAVEVSARASTKRGERAIRFRVRRYAGELEPDQLDLHRLSRGTVDLAEGVTEQEAKDLAWWAAGFPRSGHAPVGTCSCGQEHGWAVFNLRQAV